MESLQSPVLACPDPRAKGAVMPSTDIRGHTTQCVSDATEALAQLAEVAPKELGSVRGGRQVQRSVALGGSMTIGEVRQGPGSTKSRGRPP